LWKESGKGGGEGNGPVTKKRGNNKKETPVILTNKLRGAGQDRTSISTETTIKNKGKRAESPYMRKNNRQADGGREKKGPNAGKSVDCKEVGEKLLTRI